MSAQDALLIVWGLGLRYSRLHRVTMEKVTALKWLPIASV